MTRTTPFAFEVGIAAGSETAPTLPEVIDTIQRIYDAISGDHENWLDDSATAERIAREPVAAIQYALVSLYGEEFADQIVDGESEVAPMDGALDGGMSMALGGEQLATSDEWLKRINERLIDETLRVSEANDLRSALTTKHWERLDEWWAGVSNSDETGERDQTQGTPDESEAWTKRINALLDDGRIQIDEANDMRRAVAASDYPRLHTWYGPASKRQRLSVNTPERVQKFLQKDRDRRVEEGHQRDDAIAKEVLRV